MFQDEASQMAAKLRRISAEKGDSIKPEDLLIPEIQWIINCTPLTDVDRKFAELRFLRGMRASDIMEELGWYSRHTFGNHNKKVWAKLVQTLHRLID